MGAMPAGGIRPATGVRSTGGRDPYAATRVWDASRKVRRERGLGQVATPPAIGRAMARWVTSNGARTILDPAVGLGNLLVECRALAPGCATVGVDRDPAVLRLATRTAPAGTRLVAGDYLGTDLEPADGIIANPPYVGAKSLALSAAEWVRLELRLGTRLDRLTNLYAMFLLKIWRDLARGGRAAVIVPAEFLNANFGTEIKERLRRDLRPRGILVFRPDVNLFPGALTTSCIVFLEKPSRGADLPAAAAATADDAGAFVDFLLGGAPPASRVTDLSGVPAAAKWLNRVLRTTDEPARLPHTLGRYFRCRRGIATGANGFFLLSRPAMVKAGLRPADVLPCVGKARDVGGMRFDAGDFARLAASGRPCFLLNPIRASEQTRAYLARGVRAGVHRRYLPAHRRVWYLPEPRRPADVWVCVFSRERIKAVRNAAGIRSLTCFHGLFMRKPDPGLAVLLTYFLNSTPGRTAFLSINRSYGDGLNKVEPKDVEAMPCPAFPAVSSTEARRLDRRLGGLATLPAPERQREIDGVIARIISG